MTTGRAVTSGALPLALRHPIVATVVQCAATAILDLSGSGPAATQSFPALTISVLVTHVALIALRHSWKIAVGAWWTLAGVSVLLVTLAGPDDKQTPYDETLARLPELVEATGRYGGPVTLTVEPDVVPVPDTVGTIVYRIVQEALSNVVRHAPGASATVRVAREGTELVVTVANTPACGGTDDRGSTG